MIAAQYSQEPIRLQLSVTGGSPYDANTGTTPRMWRASNVAFQVAVFDAYNNPVDLSNLASMQLVLQQSNTSLVQSVAITVPASSFTTTYCDWADWQTGLLQNATFNITAALADLSLGAQSSAQYWLIVQGLSTTNQVITYTAGYITVINTSWALPTPPQLYTSENEQTNVSGNNSILPTTSNHTEIITFTGTARTSNIIISTAGAVSGAHVKVVLLLPATSGILIKIYNGSITGVLLTSITTTGGFLSATFDYVWSVGQGKFVPTLYSIPSVTS